MNGFMESATGAVATGTGHVLAAATRLGSALRSAPKPLHPRGSVWQAEVVRVGTLLPTGVPWLDEPGRDPALVRVSAAIGLPHGWPDLQGVAIRLPDQQGADLLLGSTGAGRLSRFLLRPVRPSSRHLTSTLVPYRGPAGPILLAAVQTQPEEYVLLRAEGTGEWIGFAHLRLLHETDEEPSYDPIRRPLPGLRNYAWVSRVRAPAYRVARSSRGDTASVPAGAGATLETT
ncbi:hypothetical protein [Aeromicrobium duanguangcaii]|uniref:Phosphodiesterase n=1 Tax=Aeromicrobium duanguangcaii TaxID=2968086 RepID=A0ABY5KEA9_9ACTN|nr:hypothetical protein [Aeromicrobium duanguangcaii]MCD9154820.1 hypothetical protein [Aeromicrobium duanguangcaii]UUI67766.1 hypothetical protein NP095_11230 [Aeromicrobium duanguangcaii]